MRWGRRSPDQQRESGFERFRLTELLDAQEHDSEALEAARRTDLARVSRQLTELSGISPDHPDYLEIQRIVGEYEQVFDRAIERALAE